ncbi:coiled-coil domain-containing protein 94-like [Lingula anatina]|uniref:Splicing factor YJU2 n=1 Tax=Lingula anatina TaxID=7574 RepID=A0A1S3KGN4_LINAN|nr:coiled-coil domain-containing protein 94-like [Lingula anatina]|eukprot:XP_013421805.1 coiled-coil domain-containing protein 94-like [Lingula anatina]
MSERKVLNKYYPPDFDPSKVPKLKQARNRVYNIRTMAPFNMRCNTCGEYIYKGKKFNSRTELVENENYLGLHIRRFYIRCPRCVAEISFKTDLENTDYAIEAGATRNFEAMKTAEKLARDEIKQKEEEEANNPMKLLENRTKQSRNEMEMLENLEELREINSRKEKVDQNTMLELHAAYEEQLAKLQDEEDEKFIQSVFGKKDEGLVKRIHDSDDSDSEEVPVMKKFAVGDKPTDILAEDVNTEKTTQVTSSSSKTSTSSQQKPWKKSQGVMSKKSSLKGLVLVKPKKDSNTETKHVSTPTAGENGSASVSDETNDKEKTLANGTTNVSNNVKSSSTATASKPVVAGGLSLLGNYSDSSNSEDSD